MLCWSVSVSASFHWHQGRDSWIPEELGGCIPNWGADTTNSYSLATTWTRRSTPVSIWRCCLVKKKKNWTWFDLTQTKHEENFSMGLKPGFSGCFRREFLISEAGPLLLEGPSCVILSLTFLNRTRSFARYSYERQTPQNVLWTISQEIRFY